ncbi:hypothetical protein [Streptosporangium canum]|uniref:hypothetical protein n=1 Tax=Streptosporangium canum TaxID=324952 RepID=UPI0033BECF7B
MPDLLAEAVQAAAEALADYETEPHGDVRLNSQRAAAKAVAAAAPLIAEQARAEERATIAADLRAEGERERERLREFKGLGPDVDPCHVSDALNN